MFLKNVIGVFCDSNLNLLFSATDKTEKGAKSGTNKQTRDEQVRPRSGKVRLRFNFDKTKFDPHPRQGQRWESSTSNLTLFNVHSDQFTAQFSSNGAVHGSIRPEIKSSQGSEKKNSSGESGARRISDFDSSQPSEGLEKSPSLVSILLALRDAGCSL